MNFKKVIGLILICATTISITTACSIGGNSYKNKEGVYLNKKYNTSDMVMLNGTKLNAENAFMDKDCGMGYTPTNVMNEMIEKNVLDRGVFVPDGFAFYLYPAKQIEMIKKTDFESMTEEDITKVYTDFFKTGLDFMMIWRVTEGQEDNYKEKYETVETIGIIGEDTYYLGYNTDYASLPFEAQDKENAEKLIADIENIKNNICLFTAIDTRDEKFAGNMNKFEAKTLSDETVTQDILQKYDLTMVNIWATWCGPCVAELPELQELYTKLPENVNMLTICTDGESDKEAAKEILESANSTFMTLIPDKKLEDSLLSSVSAFPTTIFIDAKGNVVGNTQIGAPDQEGKIADGYMNLINKYLEEIGK